jgi:hypothetical protein
VSHTTRLTVIVPCIDSIESAEQSVCSVLDQAIAGVQVVVTLPSASSEAREIFGQYPVASLPLSPFMQHTQASAVNAAMKLALGSWVMILPPGDLLLPGALSQAMARLDDTGSQGWVVARALRFDASDHFLDTTSAPTSAPVMRSLTDPGRDIALSTMFFSRAAMHAAGAMDADAGSDWAQEFCFRMLALGHRPRSLSQTLSLHRCVSTPAASAATKRVATTTNHSIKSRRKAA